MDTVGSTFLPPGNSTIAPEVDSLFNFILTASIILFLVVIAGIVFFAWRYRRREKDELTTSVSHHTPLEIIWTVIPVILIIIVFIWGFRTYVKMHVVPGDSLEIKVTGQKWFWTFDYPQGANSLNELVVPVDRPIKLLLSSKDVIHSFFVPNFRVKMDVLPNRYTIAWFQATRTGEYNLFCTEFCGKGHSEMIGKVRVMEQAQFDKWLEEGAVVGEGMSPEEFGKQLYTKKACVTCHSLDGSIIQGPSFLGLYGHEVLVSDGTRLTADENYIRESILSPRAKIVNGFQPVMPTYQGILKQGEVDALIAFIKSLNQQRGADGSGI
jgi:cytochrome c oxidase subunit 2